MSSKRRFRREREQQAARKLVRAQLLQQYLEANGRFHPTDPKGYRNSLQRLADSLRAFLPVALSIGRALFPTLLRLLRRG